jgi:hypothetical protein
MRDMSTFGSLQLMGLLLAVLTPAAAVAVAAAVFQLQVKQRKGANADLRLGVPQLFTAFVCVQHSKLCVVTYSVGHVAVPPKHSTDPWCMCALSVMCRLPSPAAVHPCACRTSV